MLRKILLAVDGSIHSKSALAYVASLYHDSSDVQFTLFNVQPFVSQYLVDEARTNHKAEAELQRVMQQQTLDSTELLEDARNHFIRLGIDASKVSAHSQVRRQGQAKDIIDHAHKHLFHAVVVGRRGLSRIQKAFMGSTSAKVVEHAAAIPVWIVDGDVQARKILVAVDVSDTALQLVDYLGLMAAGCAGLKVMLYHVDETPVWSDGLLDQPRQELSAIAARGERRWQDRFWNEAVARLAAAGIESDQVERLNPLHRGRVAKMILEQVQSGGCDTVVLGRRGSGNAFFFGSVAHYVAERISESALWLVG